MKPEHIEAVSLPRLEIFDLHAMLKQLLLVSNDFIVHYSSVASHAIFAVEHL